MEQACKVLSKSLTSGLVLATLMLAGAFVGFIAAPLCVVAIHGYDHGHQTEEMAIWTIIGGALASLGLHLVRSTRR